VFALNGDPAPGLVTTQDEFAIAFTEAEIRANVAAFLETNSEAEARELFRLCSQNQWNYENAVQALQTEDWTQQITRILYRPFDLRWTVFNRHVAVHRRERVMNHMLAGPNIGLVTARANRSPNKDHFLCSRFITEAKTGESTIQSYLLPLYLYPQNDAAQAKLIQHQGRVSNLAPKFVADLTQRLGVQWVDDGAGDLAHTVGPDDAFHYAYAVFHSPTYRRRYARFLTTDFPRLPLTQNLKLFAQLAAKGRELTGLHLMEAPKLENLVTEFPVKGDNIVEKVSYETDNSRVWINAQQYFEKVPKQTWEFEVGGYQVCEKWLKDRKGRKLSYDDVQHWQKIVVAINETTRLTKEIDKLIPDWPLP